MKRLVAWWKIKVIGIHGIRHRDAIYKLVAQMNEDLGVN